MAVDLLLCTVSGCDTGSRFLDAAPLGPLTFVVTQAGEAFTSRGRQPDLGGGEGGWLARWRGRSWPQEGRGTTAGGGGPLLPRS